MKSCERALNQGMNLNRTLQKYRHSEVMRFSRSLVEGQNYRAMVTGTFQLDSTVTIEVICQDHAFKDTTVNRHTAITLDIS